MRLDGWPEGLDVTPAPEKQEHDGCDEADQLDGVGEPLRVGKPGHFPEIHAEYAGDECCRHEDGGNDGQGSDLQVDLVADGGQVDIKQSGGQVA